MGHLLIALGVLAALLLVGKLTAKLLERWTLARARRRRAKGARSNPTSVRKN